MTSAKREGVDSRARRGLRATPANLLAMRPWRSILTFAGHARRMAARPGDSPRRPDSHASNREGDSMSYTPGRFVWFEHLSNDIPRARAFYEKLFGWNTES